MAAILLAAVALRLAPWLANLPLHHDEALYGAWARAIADGSDPLLLIPWIDKPPLALYLLAAGVKLFGVSELALRAPGMLAGLLTVWATYGLARRVYGERVALIAAALFALSPFAILFAPTAFTDPWLTLFLVSAAWAALVRRPVLAGVLAGLAAASKQQGVFAAPLVVALLVVAAWQARPQRRKQALLPALAWAVLGYGVVFGLVTYWDSLRWHNRPSYWDQSLQMYGGVALAALADLPKRAGEWAQQMFLLFGAWWLTLLVLCAAALGLRYAPKRLALTGKRATGGVLAAYVAGYLLVHIAFTFQPWDRYLLPILPLICLLAGAGLVVIWQSATALRSPVWRRATVAVGAGLAIYAASLGVTAAIPAGSDVGAYRGVAQAATFLAEQPGHPTVHHDRLGWHLDYYLYGLPVTRSWFDSPRKLASETARMARERPGSPQWLALPAWEASRFPALANALAQQGFAAEPDVEVVAADGRTVDLTLYRLVRVPPELASARAKVPAP
jgi:4-amino-4-deoxy-L-arabinose transferase-like glycosyltransferase